MEDKIWNRLKSLDSSDLKLVHYYQLDIDLKYTDIEILFKNFIEKYYFDYKVNEKIFSDNEIDKLSLKLSLFEPIFAKVLQTLFEDSVRSYNDDMILFYFKNSDQALILYKSFFELQKIPEIRLPHYCYYIKNTDTIKVLNKQFKDNENLCMINCCKN